MKHLKLFESFDSPQQTPIDQRLLGISKATLTEEKILELVEEFAREDNPEAIAHLMRLAANYKPGLFLKNSPEFDEKRAIQFTEKLGKIMNDFPQILDKIEKLDFAGGPPPDHKPSPYSQTPPTKQIWMRG